MHIIIITVGYVQEETNRHNLVSETDKQADRRDKKKYTERTIPKDTLYTIPYYQQPACMYAS